MTISVEESIKRFQEFAAYNRPRIESIAICASRWGVKKATVKTYILMGGRELNKLYHKEMLESKVTALETMVKLDEEIMYELRDKIKKLSERGFLDRVFNR